MINKTLTYLQSNAEAGKEFHAFTILHDSADCGQQKSLCFVRLKLRCYAYAWLCLVLKV